MNNVQLLGRIVTQPETKRGNSGGRDWVQVNFRFAVRRPGAQKLRAEGKDDSYFFSVQAWGLTAEHILERGYQSGDAILIQGALENNPYTPQGRDKPIDSISVNIDRHWFISAPKGRQGENGQQTNTGYQQPATTAEPAAQPAPQPSAQPTAQPAAAPATEADGAYDF